MSRFWEWFGRDVGLTEDEIAQVWDAISTAQSSAVGWWREAVVRFDAAPPGEPSAAVFLAATATPDRIMRVLEALVAERRMARRQVTQVEEKLLERIDAAGCWK
jgi:hypothetical protein